MSTRPEDYTVAWICAVEIERVVAREMLDEEYPRHRAPLIDTTRDYNSYTFGRISQHNVVIASLPQGRYGVTSAAVVATHVQSSFPSLEIRLMVGIAGGAPSHKHDIRLGDVVVSSPTPRYSGVLQYDFGKTVQECEFEITGHMNSPPDRLLNAVSHMKAQHKADGHAIQSTIVKMLENNPRLAAECHRPGPEQDRLYHSSYDPTVHYGLVASANSLMKDAIVRDAIIEKHDVLCFEMEAAGLMNSFPCLVVRGICDYSDSHKNKTWQGYAAATAAAYAKDLLNLVSTGHGRVAQDNSTSFAVSFSLEGVPLPKEFISRPIEMKVLEESLLSVPESSSASHRRQTFVLRGLGGIGKTQLAVEFMRLHKADFSAIFWIDGSTKDNLKRDLVRNIKRIPQNQLTIASRNYIESGQGDIDTAVQETLAWLEKPSNNRWLLIFDNVDRDFDPFNPSKSIEQDPLAYDIRQFLPKADHGSVLITTRLVRMERLGQSREIRKVDGNTANNMLKSWYKKVTYNEYEIRQLLDNLDGLPLAITQAGAYLQETGMSVKDYLQLYNRRQSEVTRFLSGEDNTLLNDYAGRSLWTTWIISFEAVSARNKYAANMLIFWSFLDRNGIWYGLFQKALKEPVISEALSRWLGSTISDMLSFINTMRLLRSYSLIEGSDDNDSYNMHAVVHRWIYFYQGIQRQLDIGTLAFIVVVLSTPLIEGQNFGQLQARVSPHIQSCRDKGIGEQASSEQNSTSDNIQDLITIPGRDKIMAGVFFELGKFYQGQRKYTECEQVLQRALQGYQKLAGVEDYGVAHILCALATVYNEQGKSVDAEQMLLRALKDNQQNEDMENLLTQDIYHELALLYVQQKKFAKAEQMFVQALQGRQQALDSEWMAIANGLDDHVSAANTISDSALLDVEQCKLDRTKQSHEQELQSNEQVPDRRLFKTLNIINSLGYLFYTQGKLIQAERMIQQAVRGYKQAFGLEHRWTLSCVDNLGKVYHAQGQLDKAEKMLLYAFRGFEKEYGNKGELTLNTAHKLAEIYTVQGRYEEAEQMHKLALQGYEENLGLEGIKTFIPALCVMYNLGNLYWNTGDWPQAKVMYERALAGYQEVNGASSNEYIELQQYLLEGPIDPANLYRGTRPVRAESSYPDSSRSDDHDLASDLQECDDPDNMKGEDRKSNLILQQEKRPGKMKRLIQRFKRF